MTNAELIKAMRYCPSHGCGRCVAVDENGVCTLHGVVGIMNSAADALEAAEKRIAELEAQLPKEAHWVAVQNGVGVCSNCNRQDRIDNLATHCRYCGSRIKYSCKDLFDDASNLPVDYSRCANIYCANDKNNSENPNS